MVDRHRIVGISGSDETGAVEPTAIDGTYDDPRSVVSRVGVIEPWVVVHAHLGCFGDAHRIVECALGDLGCAGQTGAHDRREHEGKAVLTVIERGRSPIAEVHRRLVGVYVDTDDVGRTEALFVHHIVERSGWPYVCSGRRRTA